MKPHKNENVNACTVAICIGSFRVNVLSNHRHALTQYVGSLITN